MGQLATIEVDERTADLIDHYRWLWHKPDYVVIERIWRWYVKHHPEMQEALR